MSTRTSLCLSFDELRRRRELMSEMISGFPEEISDAQVRYYLCNTKELHKGIRDLLLRQNASNLITPANSDFKFSSFNLVIRYDQYIKELIARGRYDEVRDTVNPINFDDEINARVRDVVHLLDFGRSISSKGAISKMDEYGLRPVTLKEILSFGARYPNEQKKNPIVGLGSTWQGPGGPLGVPVLWFVFDKRGLDLDCFWGDWGGDCRFLAIRK